MAEFGPVLRKFRTAAGFSQEQLAGVSGVSVEAIKTLEAGRRRNPRRRTVELLSNGLSLSGDERAELKGAAARPSTGRLPTDVADFVGRTEQIAAVSGLLTGGGQAPGVVVISAIAGMGGVGKTALAVRVARGLAGQFADGVLYVNLRGFGIGDPMTPLEALSALLQQLGFALQRPPESVDEAAGLFRTACAPRKLLVVLDDAATVEQVRPLLPGTSTCAVIVTSRRALIGLPGARPLELPVLLADEGLALLTSVAGRSRISGDPQAAREVVALCGSLPLAIRIAGSRLAAEPRWTVSELARRLADQSARLDMLSGDGVDVRASIALSLHGTSASDAAAAEVFGLLGLYEGDELDLKVAARLVDRPEAEVEVLLEHLVDLHLLESSGPRRYRFYDLVRAYAQELAARQIDAAGRTAARDRVLALYVAMGWRVRTSAGVSALSRDWFDEQWVNGTEDLTVSEVLTWLDGEADEIVAATRRLAGSPQPDRPTVVKIAVGMVPFCAGRRRSADGVHLGLLAAAALRSDPACGPPQALAIVSHDLAKHYGSLSDFGPAIDHMTFALDESVARGYQDMQLYSLLGLGQFLERTGRVDESLAHIRAALELALSTDNAFAQGSARLTLGVLAGRRGRPDEQDQEFGRADVLIRGSEVKTELQWMARIVSTSYRDCGRPEAALAWLVAALPDIQAMDRAIVLADHLQLLGATEVELAAYHAARDHLEEALALIGDTAGELAGRIRHSLGDALSGLGEAEPAREQWLAALELYRRYGLPQIGEVLKLLDLVDDGEDGEEAEG